MFNQISGNQTSYYLSDHLGSTTALTYSTGAITDQTQYDSFGNQTNQDFPSRYQFTGREKGDFAGLYYYRARWYSSQLGRFISEDPIGFATGDVNFYGYVSNNPINATDPTGLYEEDVHYYLTNFLARKNGCFSLYEANEIAEGNQGTDEDYDKYPGQGRIGPNSVFHALNSAASPGVGSGLLWDVATMPTPNNSRFGNYLHYLQDTYSHQGFSDPIWGHSPINWGDHAVDKTATDVEKTLAMAKATYSAISDYSKTRCGCAGNSWDNSWEDQINRFSRIRTRFPGIADINGNVFGDLTLNFLGYPEANRVKALILDIPTRR